MLAFTPWVSLSPLLLEITAHGSCLTQYEVMYLAMECGVFELYNPANACIHLEKSCRAFTSREKSGGLQHTPERFLQRRRVKHQAQCSVVRIGIGAAVVHAAWYSVYNVVVISASAYPF